MESCKVKIKQLLLILLIMLFTSFAGANQSPVYMMPYPDTYGVNGLWHFNDTIEASDGLSEAAA